MSLTSNCLDRCLDPAVLITDVIAWVPTAIGRQWEKSQENHGDRNSDILEPLQQSHQLPPSRCLIRWEKVNHYMSVLLNSAHGSRTRFLTDAGETLQPFSITSWKMGVRLDEKARTQSSACGMFRFVLKLYIYGIWEGKRLKYVKMLVVAVSRLWVIYYYDDLRFSMLSKFSTLRNLKNVFKIALHTHTRLGRAQIG